MTRIFLLSVIFGFFLGYAVRGNAAETGASITQASLRKPALSNYSLSLAASYGPSSLSENDAPDLDTHGSFREILAMLERSAPRWNFGAGIGIFSSNLTGTSHSGTGSGSGLSLSSYSREIAGEVARAEARYRFTDHLEAGLFADLLFGSDVGFSSNFFESETNTAWLGGTEFLYGFDLMGLRIKAGARYFASLSLPGRKLDAVQGVLEAAMPVF